MKPVKRPYSERQVLICTNLRDPITGKASCGANGSGGFREYLKKTVKERGLKGRVLITGTTCMDICPSQGCAVAVYPEGEFFVSDTSVEAAEALLGRVVGE